MECDSSAISGQFDKYIFATQQSPAFRYRYLLRIGDCATSANLSHGSKVSNRNADLTENGREEITRTAKSKEVQHYISRHPNKPSQFCCTDCKDNFQYLQNEN